MPALKRPDGRQGSDANAKKQGSNMEGLITKILLGVIMVLLISLPILLIKFNVKGFGEKLRPIIEDIPYVQKILPKKQDPSDPGLMNKKELLEAYLSYKEKFTQLDSESQALRSELQELSNIKNNYEQFQNDQTEIEMIKAQLQANRIELEADKDAFLKQIAEGNPIDFKSFFEKIDKIKAEKLYEDILKKEKIDEKIKEYISFYEKMDPENAAKIFDEMGVSKMDLIVNILKDMNKENAAEILASMKPNTAAKVSERLSKEYPIGN